MKERAPNIATLGPNLAAVLKYVDADHKYVAADLKYLPVYVFLCGYPPPFCVFATLSSVLDSEYEHLSTFSCAVSPP